MHIPDVNVLLGAHRADDPNHVPLRQWLEDRLTDIERLGVSELVLSAVVRIATNRKAYIDPATPEEALRFCEAVRTAGSATIVSPGERHWEIFADLVRATHATANLVPDAYLAALAIENGATFVSRDRGFRRFPGLRLLDPLAA
jgi:toxin-antitoxin system PIN domain toxin